MARRFGGWRGAVGLASTVAFSWLALRRVEWGVTADALRNAAPSLLVVGAAALVATYAMFAVRWRTLLRETAPVSTADACSFIMIGYLASTVLPLRLGDVARAVLLRRRYSVSAVRVGATLVLERLLDVVALLLIALLVSAKVPIPPAARVSFLVVALGGITAVATLALLARGEGWVWALVQRVPLVGRRLPLARLRPHVARFAEGLGALRSPGQGAVVLGWSAVAWLLAGCANVAFVRAFHLSAPWYAGFFVLVVVNLGSTIPSSPGFVGVYHFLAVFALSPWVPDRSSALAFAIVTHAVNILLNVVLGLVALTHEGADWRALRLASAADG